jgi:hypothetical protein
MIGRLTLTPDQAQLLRLSSDASGASVLIGA